MPCIAALNITSTLSAHCSSCGHADCSYPSVKEVRHQQKNTHNKIDFLSVWHFASVCHWWELEKATFNDPCTNGIWAHALSAAFRLKNTYVYLRSANSCTLRPAFCVEHDTHTHSRPVRLASLITCTFYTGFDTIFLFFPTFARMKTRYGWETWLCVRVWVRCALPMMLALTQTTF